MAFARDVQAEYLDELPDGDPRAKRARRELRTINFLMGNSHILARALALHSGAGRRLAVAEIGSGDGTAIAKVARILSTPGIELTLLDRSAVPSAEASRTLKERGWMVRMVRADVFEWLASGQSTFDVIVANLFLHHFRPPALEELLALIAARTRLFIACEPQRSSFALLASRLLWALGCGEVTRHDAQASVRAGFRSDELTAMWPVRNGWTLDEGQRGLFSHSFVAVRHGGA